MSLLKPSVIYLSKNLCDVFLICWFRRRVLCKWKYVPALHQTPTKPHREGTWASLLFFSLTLIKYKPAVSFLLKPGSLPSVIYCRLLFACVNLWSLSVSPLQSLNNILFPISLFRRNPHDPFTKAC